ncbi:MAG: deoxyribonuclease IV [Bdellovibrionota bacterium]
MILGAHESVAGGLSLVFGRAREHACEAIQIFSRNQQQWKAKPVTAEEAREFREEAGRQGYELNRLIVHGSYLVNLGSPDARKRDLSRKTLLAEIHRCEALGLRYLNLHPGSHDGKGEKEGLTRIVDSFNWLLDKTPKSPVLFVLETTAGQGTQLGWRFEHLREIFDGVSNKKRFAVCLDTAHTFAAGYDFSTDEGYEQVMEEFDRVVGLSRLVAFHLNDSKRPLGSRVDRHEEIGKGFIGKRAFELLMHDKRHAKCLGVLELPLPVVPRNLALLRKFSGK